MRPISRTADEIIAALGSRAHGVATRAELLLAGCSSEQIQRRVSRGALIPVHRGVYRVGHAAPSREATYLAAVRACGAHALLAGRAAGHLWGLIKGPPPAPEVFAPVQRRVPGVVVHRIRRAAMPRRVTRAGIPVTTVPRTLVDLASSLPAVALARACHEAGVLHDTTPRQVERVLDDRPNAPGAATLRRVLNGDTKVTLSRLESRFLRLLGEHDLPLPDTNRPAGGRRVDCRWPDRRLTVELDGYRYHRSRHAWELDRRREREARARGDDFRRFTYGDVFEDPDPMLRELRTALSREAR